MNEEYEYSFKVMELESFINYCVNNQYELEKEYEQTRTLYKNGGRVMARITKNVFEGNVVEILNFKDDDVSDHSLKICRETKDLKITDENRDFVSSLLEILDLKETKKLIRNRLVYKKGNVIFELDKYTTPIMNVVAIEGKKEEVDMVYNQLKSVIDSSKIE